MISTILQYSTIDFRFLDANLKQLSKFSNEIIIPICTHLFNGEEEDFNLLVKSKEIIKKYPLARVKVFEWEGIKNNKGYYHNVSRKLGTDLSQNEWLYFVDGDEITDDNFIPWFEKIKNTDYGFQLTSYWYFREPIYQATKTEAQGLLLKKKYCNWQINVREERDQMHHLPNFIHGERQLIFGLDGKSMVHHYSWVRSKEDMLRKVKNWGHCHDRDWVSQVNEEFSRPFNGTDFVHGYNYNIVDNYFNI
jgi:hypothetical protein